MATRDLTTCKPASGLIRFAVPLILGNMFQQLYNLVDTIVVGNYCGRHALAAVGASAPVTTLFICISVGGGIGSSVIIAQMYGARKMGRMMTAIKTACTVFFIIGAVLMAAGIFLNKIILGWLNTPADIIDDAALYMRIYFYGFLFMMMFNVFNAVFNALGDSRKPLIFLTASSILNIFLNIYFITKLGMTVDGVAWATVISQGLAVIATVIVLVVKLRRMNITEPSKWFEGKVCRTIFKVAGPTILQQSVVAVGLLLMQSVINGFGSIAVAGYTAANKIDLMAILPMTNMGNAVSTFTAQNIGAGKKERIPQGLRAGLIAVVVTGLVIAALLVVFGNALVGLFVSGEGAEAVIEEGARYLKISSIFYFIFGAMNSLSGVLRGSGDMPRFLATTMTNFGVRIILSFTVAAHMGLYMVAWSTVIGWVVSFVLAAIFYRSGKWMKKELI